jgi:acetyl esterase/lipase
MPTRRERYLRFLVVALQLIVALVAAAAALLVLVPAQTTLLWMLEIIAREQGYWFALLTIAVAAIGLIAKSVRSSRAQRVAIGISLIAGLVLLKPTVQAILVGRSLPARLATVGDTTPRATSAAPARHAPVQFATLFTGIPVHLRPRTLSYAAANGDTLRMDFIAAATQPAPLVVVIHGGAWRTGSRADMAELGQYLADRGYAVAAVSYRLAPRFQYPAAREDVRRAILYLEQNGPSLGVDPTRIVLLGRSAGGHLALLSAYADRDPAIRGVVGLYPPVDLRWAHAHPSNPRVLNSTRVLEEFLGGSPAATGNRYKEASPLSYVDSGTPPTLLIHGEGDELVFTENVRRLDARLAATTRPHVLITLPWATHACDYFIAGPCGQIVTYAVERFVAAVTR